MTTASIFERFREFQGRAQKVIGDSQVDRTNDIDYDEYIINLNRVAEQALGLSKDYKVAFKAVYLHGRNIHTLIYRVDYQGRRYSAGITRRVSLGVRDQAGDRWQSQLKKAHRIAMDQPPVALDPALEELPSWRESNRNKSRMTFREGEALVILNTTKVVKASGPRDGLVGILDQLRKRGL